MAARGIRLQPIYRHAGALGASKDGFGADGRSPGYIGRRHQVTDKGHRADYRHVGRQAPDADRCRGRRGAHPTAAAFVSSARGGRGGGCVRLIDSHCHLNYEGLVERQDEVLENARERGVAGFLNISTRQREWGDIIAVAERNDDVWATVGVHPHEADSHHHLGAAAPFAGSSHPRVIAIGECGLDYYYDKSDRKAQRERFQAHIEAARQTGLPLVVHTRDAEEDTAEILGEAVREGGVTGVFHCFTGSAELAAKALDLGFFISLSGIVTFKNAQDLQHTARQLPLDSLLVETDSPFLAPVPHRGQKCEPAFVADTANFVAELRGEDPEQLAEATTENFFRLFSRAKA